MNNSIANATSNSSVIASEFIREVYLGYIGSLVDASALTLLFYATVLAMQQEMEYIWLSPKPFSIPNLLYACTRYASLITQALAFRGDFVQLGSLCNSLDDASNATIILAYVGVQGLLTVRAYSLCQTNKVMAAALAFFFVGGLILYFYSAIALSGCRESFDTEDLLVSMIIDICVVVTDFLAFFICLWRVWSTWRLRHETSIQSSNDLVTMLFRQIVSRFCFVIVITVTFTILNRFVNGFIIDILGSFQHLRQQNSAAIQATNMTLPTLRFQSMVTYIHQSIIVGMGDNENIHTREGGGDGSSESSNFEIQSEAST